MAGEDNPFPELEAAFALLWGFAMAHKPESERIGWHELAAELDRARLVVVRRREPDGSVTLDVDAFAQGRRLEDAGAPYGAAQEGKKALELIAGRWGLTLGMVSLLTMAFLTVEGDPRAPQVLELLASQEAERAGFFAGAFLRYVGRDLGLDSFDPEVERVCLQILRNIAAALKAEREAMN